MVVEARSTGRPRSRGRSVVSRRQEGSAGRSKTNHEEQPDGDKDEIHLAADLYKKKRALESVSSEIQSRLETSLQELQGEFDSRFGKLSDEIQGMFKRVEGVSDGIDKTHVNKQSRKVFVPQDSLLSKMLNYEDENYKVRFLHQHIRLPPTPL